MIARAGAFVAGLTLVFAPSEARCAVGSAAAEAQIARCIQRAASGRAWLEKTLWGLRDQEAGWVGARVRNRNGTHDLGPLQVNSEWVARIAQLTKRQPTQVRYQLTYDACFNVDAARWIFLTALAKTENYWKAIGVYHSPTSWRQQRYIYGVVRKLERRFGRFAVSKRLVKKACRDWSQSVLRTGMRSASPADRRQQRTLRMAGRPGQGRLDSSYCAISAQRHWQPSGEKKKDLSWSDLAKVAYLA